MNSKILIHLVWKDFRVIHALAMAVIAGVVIFNLVQFFAGSGFQRDIDRFWFAYGTWILLPNLLALGAPAILVGSEEESGSLAWLRTLPASWSAIGGSKLIVGFATLAVVLILSGIAFALHWNHFSEQQLNRMDAMRVLPAHLSLHYFGNAIFSVMVLLVSFMTAYQFRSPVTGLVVVVPVLCGGMWAFQVASEQLRLSGFGDSPWWDIASQHTLAFGAGTVAVVALLVVVVQWFARRRLIGPETRSSRVSIPAVAQDAFRPPLTSQAGLASGSWYGVSLAHRTPTLAAALMWQSTRQMGWGLFGAVVLMVIGFLIGWSTVGLAEPVGVLFGISGFVVISGMTFYGDSVRNRCLFLFDRGVSPTLVWLTRLLPTALVTLFFLMLFIAAGLYYQQTLIELLGAIGMILGFYALAQLASLCSPRPILVFFAAPVLFVFAAFLFRPLFIEYPWGISVLLFCVPVLLFASWRLMPRWLRGARDRRMLGTAFGYALVALAIPYTLVLGARWLALPAERTEWRRQMATRDLDPGVSEQSGLAFSNPVFKATADELIAMEIVDGERSSAVNSAELLIKEVGIGTLGDLGQTSGHLVSRLRTEVSDPQRVGATVAFPELDELSYRGQPIIETVHREGRFFGMGFESLPVSPGPKLGREALERHLAEQVLVAKALVKRSRVLRQKVLAGQGGFAKARAADQIEAAVADLLDEFMRFDVSITDLQDIAQALPEDALRRQSRLAGLTSSWRRVEAGRIDPTFSDRTAPTSFAVERTRRKRLLDEAVFSIDQQIKSGAMFAGAPAREALEQQLIELAILPTRREGTVARRVYFGERIHAAKVVDDRLDAFQRNIRARAEQAE